MTTTATVSLTALPVAFSAAALADDNYCIPPAGKQPYVGSPPRTALIGSDQAHERGVCGQGGVNFQTVVSYRLRLLVRMEKCTERCGLAASA